MRPGHLRKILCALLTFATVSLARDDLKEFLGGNVISHAHAQAQARRAVRHRPVYRAPVTARGVARRTTRRVIRRTALSVPVLPVGCAFVHINGIGYHHCGSLYYERVGGRYVKITVN